MEGSDHLEAPAVLPTGNEPPSPTGNETEWITEPNWTLRRREKSLILPGIESRFPTTLRYFRRCDVTKRNILARTTVNSGSERDIFR
jgi:hypothetical protein